MVEFINCTIKAEIDNCFNNFEFKMSDSYSEDYSESKECPACLNLTFKKSMYFASVKI